MQKAETNYLELLREACLGPQPADMMLLREDVRSILYLCRLHGTEPLVYNELLKNHADLLTAEEQTQMKQACMRNMMQQSRWEQLIVKVWNAFEAHNVECKVQSERIHAVLMKGFSYANLYPLPYLRSWGDLDVWVGPEQYHKACGILREAFPEAKHHDEEWDELKHYCFVFPDGMAIELHRVSMDFLSRRDQAYWETLEAEASQSAECKVQSAKYEVPVFEPKFDVLFCFMHSWEHFTGTGIPLKQVCDMALLVQRAKCRVQSAKWKVQSEELEAYLEKHLRALRMLDVWRAYGYMVCKAMGLAPEAWPLLVQSGKCKVQSGKCRVQSGKWKVQSGKCKVESAKWKVQSAKCKVPSSVVKYGERLYKQVIAEGQCRRKDYGGASDRFEARENARKMNILARKLFTLGSRFKQARFMHYYAPAYARDVLWQEIKKGIRRTVTGAKMIDY